MAERGKYLIIEGHEGTGKTTQRDLLVDTLVDAGINAIGVHEPGETDMGLKLENIIKNRALGRSAMTNLLLFTANRLELWQQRLQPHLENGGWVVADRNWFSSLAYQGWAEENSLGMDTVKDITAQFLPPAYLQPDKAVILQVPDERRLERMAGRQTEPENDYFESKSKDFQARLHEGYAKLEAYVSGLEYLDALGSPEEVHEKIITAFDLDELEHQAG